MHYPTLQTIPATREAVSVFLGLNRQGDISPGEFSAMENLTSRHYPRAATCSAPTVFLSGVMPEALLAKEALCYVEGEALVVGQQRYDLGLTAGVKQLVSMGAYILIMPDKKYFNTADPTDFGPIEQVVEEAQWRLDPCDEQGNLRSIHYIGEAQPESPVQGEYWCDTSGEVYKLKAYNALTEAWGPVQGYVRLELQNDSNPKWPYNRYFTDCFSTGDRVQLQILEDKLVDEYGEPLRTPTQQEALLEQTIWGLVGEAELQVVDGLRVIIPGILSEAVYLGNTLRFGSPMPNLDFMFECGNRLWGCRYGMQNGKFVNEIYASRLGDFHSWTGFQGVSTDSYIASLGTDGPFTGAMNYMGYPLFFKENYIHRVYGSYPSEYRIQTTPCAGIAPGCSGSLCLLGDTALYLGKDGVCAYDGAMPSLISRALTGLRGPAVGGVLESSYYLSTAQGLYVYDSRRRLWHRRSPVSACQMCTWDGHLLYFSQEQANILALEGGEENVEFSMETGILGGSEQRRIRSICLRYSLRGWGRVMVEYDSDGVWLAAGALPDTKLGWGNLPLKPRRCDHFRLKLCGKGRLQLHSIIKTLEKGSDLP